MGCGASGGIPEPWLEAKAKQCDDAIDVPGMGDEDEAELFQKLVEICNEHVPEGAVIAEDIAPDAPLDDEVNAGCLGDESKAAAMEHMAEEVKIPGMDEENEIVQQIHESVWEQFCSTWKNEDAPVVFPKSFKHDMTAKVNGLINLPFIDDEQQTNMFNSFFGAIDVILPKDLVGKITPDIGKGVFSGTPMPDDILEKLAAAKDTVFEKLEGAMAIPKVPIELIKKLIEKVWDAITSILSCKPFGAFPPEKKKAIVDKMNADIDIPMIGEDKEEKLFSAFFSILELCLPTSMLEKLMEDDMDDEKANEIFSEERKEETLGQLKCVDIPMMGEEKEAALCADMYASFEAAVRGALGGGGMMPGMPGMPDMPDLGGEPKVNEQGLTEDEVAQLKEAFAAADADGSGTLNHDELKQVLAEWKSTSAKEITDDMVDDVIANCDADGNGTVNFNEYVEALQNAMIEAAGGD